MYCSNCGHELAPDANFCPNCGAPVDDSGASNTSAPRGKSPLDSDRDWGGYSTGGEETREESAAPPPPPGNEPYTGDGGFADRKPDWEIERERLRSSSQDEWAMSDLGPPRGRPRRTWLWVLLGLIALVVIACCVAMWWITFTDSGIEWAEGIIATGEALATQTPDATPEP